MQIVVHIVLDLVGLIKGHILDMMPNCLLLKGYKMKYKQMSQNSWIVEVQENGKTKELFIEFPPGCIDQVGWDTGYTILWEELPNGNWSLKKKEDDSDGE